MIFKCTHEDKRDPMMMSPLTQLLEALKTQGKSPLFLSLIAAMILLSYSMLRGPSEALFLEYHDKTLLPGLWIETGLGALLTVAIYNRLLNLFSLIGLFHLSLAGSACVFALLSSGLLPFEERVFSLGEFKFPFGPVTLLRIACDLYIVVLVETFWSLTNLHFSVKSATHLYGLFGVAGSIGSMVGNTIATFSRSLGTENIIRSAIPIFLLMMITLRGLQKHLRTRVDQEQSSKRSSSLLSGISVVARSRTLLLIAALVLLSQLAVNLIDYQYNGLLKSLYPDVNARSAMNATVYLTIDIGAIVMQLLTGMTLTLLGVGMVLTSIPSILALSVLSAMISPVFWVMALAKSSSKFFTYSIFKSAKELLYLPLSYAEQTQGKAVIDILVYRQAKLLTSILLLGLAARGIENQIVNLLTLAVIGLWIIISISLWRITRDEAQKS